jgi:SAM-dependent methyltransferase
MGIYARYLLPRLTHFAMGHKLLLPYRQRVIGGATGRVLEIGVGSGLNLPLYSDGVEEVIGIDISPQLLAMAERAASLQSQRRHLRVRLIEASAETSRPRSLMAASTRWSSPGRSAAFRVSRRLSPRRSVCFAAKWLSPLRRTRTIARRVGGQVAGPSHPPVDTLLGRLSS